VFCRPLYFTAHRIPPMRTTSFIAHLAVLPSVFGDCTDTYKAKTPCAVSNLHSYCRICARAKIKLIAESDLELRSSAQPGISNQCIDPWAYLEWHNPYAPGVSKCFCTNKAHAEKYWDCFYTQVTSCTHQTEALDDIFSQFLCPLVFLNRQSIRKMPVLSRRLETEPTLA
jgi:hypothetical protein